MTGKKLTLQTKKLIAAFIHGLFVIVALTGISMMYLNSNFGKGVTWISEEVYEDTRGFYNQLQRDIKNIFSYVRYRDVFETNGKIDFTKPMLDLNYGPGDDRSYTLEDIIQYTKSRGYFLNDNYVLSGTPTDPTPEDMEEAFVEWRAYSIEDSPFAEDTESATLEELSKEVLELLGNYYSICNKLLSGSSNLYFTIVYEDPQEKSKLEYTNAPGKSAEDLTRFGQYVHLSGDSAVIDTNMNYRNFSITSYLTANNPYQSNAYYMVLALDTRYPYNDSYKKAAIEYDDLRSQYITGLVLMAVGCMVSLISLLYLMFHTGHRKEGDQTVTLRNIDKTTTETGLIILAGIVFGSLYLCRIIIVRMIHLLFSQNAWNYTEQLAYTVVVYFCLLMGGFSFIRRYKAGVIWNGSAIYRTARKFSFIFSRQNFSFQIAYYFFAYLLVNSLIIGTGLFSILNYNTSPTLMRALTIITIVLWFCVNIWVLAALYKTAIQRDVINQAIVKLSEGDTHYQVDVEQFTGKEQENALNINHLSEGLDAALKEKVKSERLKADLITNVSHDIKTPLTSIINYVDLLKREKIQDPKIAGYLEVLDQKSQRLKSLTEDLVEASKASSGNLKLEISHIDLVELIQQTNGEFEDKFAEHSLELLTELPERSIVIEADGRRLWRVLENLYNNAFKYAMKNTRVYVEVAANDDNTMVTFSIKNVSDNPLNIRGDELTERFVRGDVARTTEGSGLGLSIAKSLTELQNGQFELYIDGDLFKVLVSFPILKE